MSPQPDNDFWRLEYISLAKSIGDRFYDGIHFLSDVPPKAPPLDREVTDWLVRYADVSIKGGQNNQNIRHKAVPRTSSTPTRDVDTVDFPPHTPRKPQSRSVANTLNDPRLPSLELTDHAQTNDLLFPPNLEIYDSASAPRASGEKQEGEREMDGASPSKSGTVTLDHTSRSSPEAEGSGGYGSTDAEGDDDPEAYSSDV
ncbi:hypothetical protein C8R43DRAFT_952789 [Mycena crocata]|nr:hypothetical protein C8R43DRAFT_952789 [Mycena crocata]